MIIETPNPFSSKTDWLSFLAEMKNINLASLSANDAKDVKRAIEDAELFLDGL